MTYYLICTDLAQGCGRLFFENWMKDGPGFTDYTRATEYKTLEDAKANIERARSHMIPVYTKNLYILRVSTERIDCEETAT